MKEKAIIEKVFPRKHDTPIPTLLKFQNGQLGAVSKDAIQFCRLTRKRGKESAAKVAMVTANDQIYHGAIDAGEAASLTDTYICVRNKITNKVRIIPIEQATLNNNVYNTLEHKPLPIMTAEHTKAVLLKQFGGRKAARYASNQENNKVNVEVLKNDLDNTVRETDFTSEVVEKPDTEHNFDILRPKFNKDATKLEDIYDVNDIVPAELLERLDQEAKVVYSTTIDKLPIKSEYLCNCIKRIQDSSPTPAGFLNLKLIIYMDCLLNLLKTRVRSIKSVELSGITEKAENDVRTRFSDPHSKPFSRTSHTSEKALCHFIVLALIISENFTVDLNILAQELCVSKVKLIKFAHIVNAMRSAKTDLLTLRLPSKMTALAGGFSRKSKK
ncbi:uncharacterized protein LOC101448645 [Ceratitis capitata]|uniref:(Mediterranean fruit fly) hypothetical protein n=2 Tax=Ceratitis capitata TaxID=7213 RepID=A0A811U1S2_CERCA|nr:uncharacterized protein LOC101448645 [Ceratitis capitata]CAD6993052.1 unnamed protein product [Ceratitis capitata]